MSYFELCFRFSYQVFEFGFELAMNNELIGGK